jgi:hypothetical protein
MRSMNFVGKRVAKALTSQRETRTQTSESECWGASLPQLTVGQHSRQDNRLKEIMKTPTTGISTMLQDNLTKPKKKDEALDDAKSTRPGKLLIDALFQCASKQDLSLNDLAEKLGVTHGYINQLKNGIRCVPKISLEFSQSCADFLQVPRITVLILAGKMTAEDFVSPFPTSAREIASAFNFLLANPEFGHLITNEQRASSFETKYLLVKMFEKATGTKLLDPVLDMTALAGYSKPETNAPAAAHF